MLAEIEAEKLHLLASPVLQLYGRVYVPAQDIVSLFLHFLFFGNIMHQEEGVKAHLFENVDDAGMVFLPVQDIVIADYQADFQLPALFVPLHKIIPHPVDFAMEKVAQHN